MTAIIYGFCPQCGRPGTRRERSANGQTFCDGGHGFPHHRFNETQAKAPVRYVCSLTDAAFQRLTGEADLTPLQQKISKAHLFIAVDERDAYQFFREYARRFYFVFLAPEDIVVERENLS